MLHTPIRTVRWLGSGWVRYTRGRKDLVISGRLSLPMPGELARARSRAFTPQDGAAGRLTVHHRSPAQILKIYYGSSRQLQVVL